MARKRPRRRAYATDLTDTPWALIAPLIPEAEPGGRPRKAVTRGLVNAIFCLLRAGMAWRLLPHDLPPWQTVYYYLRQWQREGVWDWVHYTLVMADRERAGREASPTAAILDSQSVRTADQKGDRRAMMRARRSRGQAPHPDRHGRAAARPRGAWGQHPGQRWRRRPEALALSLSIRRTRLRGRRLCGPAGALGQGADPHRPGGGQAQHQAGGLCRDPAPGGSWDAMAGWREERRGMLGLVEHSGRRPRTRALRSPAPHSCRIGFLALCGSPMASIAQAGRWRRLTPSGGGIRISLSGGPV